MKKRLASRVKIALTMMCVFMLVGAFVYFSVDIPKNDFVPARAALQGTMLDTGNGMELGRNLIRTEANTPDGSQSGTGTFDGKDIYTTGNASSSFSADPNELQFTPSANGQGVHAKIIFNPSDYNNNNLYNAIREKATFTTNASLSLNVSVSDAGKTARVDVRFAWCPTGTAADEVAATRQQVVDSTGAYIEEITLSDIADLSSKTLSPNAYFSISITFNEMTASYPRMRVSGIVVKASTDMSESINISPDSKFYISGKNRRTTALDTNNRTSLPYQSTLADTFVKAGDTIILQTKVFQNTQTTDSYQLPAAYAKIFDDKGLSGTTPTYGVYWQNYASFKDNSTGQNIDDSTKRFLTIVPANSGYKAVTELDDNGQEVTVYYYQAEFTVNEGVRNAAEIIIVPQLLVKFDDRGPSCERGTTYVMQDPIRIKVDSTPPENPILVKTTGLGASIESRSWYTISDTINLTFQSTLASPQSREYIYAFVCGDPQLISTIHNNYDFTPLRTDPVSYLDSNSQERQSEPRQEITVYEQNSQGGFTMTTRPVKFIDRSEQALVLFRVDAAGNVSIPTIYYGETRVKVDSSYYTVSARFLIGRDGDTYSQELSARPNLAANVDFFAGPAYHNNNGEFTGNPSYGYSTVYEAALKRDQWVTIRLSTTAAQSAAYKLIRYKNEEAEIDFFSDAMPFIKGATGRPDYINVTFRITDEFLQGTGVFLFYFRKNANVTVTRTSFGFNQGSTIGIDDYIESYDGGQLIQGLTYTTTYYKTFVYTFAPAYESGAMQPFGTVSINQNQYSYTGNLVVGNIVTIPATGDEFYVIRRVEQTVSGVRHYQTTVYKVGTGVSGGMVDAGEYYYRVEINLNSTSIYFGAAGGLYTITPADPQIINPRARFSIVYNSYDPYSGKKGLDFLDIVSYNQQGLVIEDLFGEDNRRIVVNMGGGVEVAYTLSSLGVWGTYEIISPLRGTAQYDNPSVTNSLRVEIRFNPIKLDDPEVFTQQIIANNIAALGQFYDYIDGKYVVKRGVYHSGNFMSKTYVIYVTIENAAGDVTIEGLKEVQLNQTSIISVLDLEYSGNYKDDEIIFRTTPENDFGSPLSVKFTYTLVNDSYSEVTDENGNPITYNRIINAGKYKITYSIDPTKCNYTSAQKISYIVIHKRQLELEAQNYIELPEEFEYEGMRFAFTYMIKFGKIGGATLPPIKATIPGGAPISVQYHYSYMKIKDHAGVGVQNPQYSPMYLAGEFPNTIDVGTYLLRISVYNNNNQGEIIVHMQITSVLQSDIIQSTPRPKATYKVYNKDGTLQSIMGNTNLGHIEFGQTLAQYTDVMLGELTPTALYRIGLNNVTVQGRFVFETETAIEARYNALYGATDPRRFSLVTLNNGTKVLPVRYDQGNPNIVTYYIVYIYWEAGSYNGEEFVRDYNYGEVKYEAEIVVARATPDFSALYFEEITYGKKISDSQIVGSPAVPAYPEGMPAGSYTISYYGDTVLPKGEHLVNCAFTPTGSYLNYYRAVDDVRIPITVVAKEVTVRLRQGVPASLVFGTAYTVPACDILEEVEGQGTRTLPNPESMLSYTYRDASGNVVNISSSLGLTTYVSAKPGVYTLTVTVTSNDYTGSLVIENFTVEKGTLVKLSDPTQEVVEYGALITSIDFYGGQVQNTYTRVQYSGNFFLIPLEGDSEFVPEADREGYRVQRWLRFEPTDITLYDYYNEFTLEWTYRINKNSRDVSIVPRGETLNVTYDGTRKPVDFDITYPGSQNIKAHTTVRYYSYDGQIVYDDAPANAGTYRVVISVNSDFLNYTGTLTTTLTIAKQVININVAERYYVFNGESQGFGDIDFSGYEGDSGAIKYTIQYLRYTGASMFSEVPSEVGRYIARVTINESNYMGSADIYYYIVPSAITVSGWHYVYDDTDKVVSVNIEPSLVDFTVRYRAERRDDEGNLTGSFTETKPRDAGRYQVRIIINENGYYKEIDLFTAQETAGGLYDPALRLTIAQQSSGEYARKVATEGLTANYPLFMKIDKAYSGVIIESMYQNRVLTYTGNAAFTMATLIPNTLRPNYIYTPCAFEIVDNTVVPVLVNGQPVPLADISDVEFDNLGRPKSVGYYVVTLTLDHKDYQIGEYVKPTIIINPAPLVVDLPPQVKGNIYYGQTEPVEFIEGSGQVRFAAGNLRINEGVWELTADISHLRVGTYENIPVKFTPYKNGKPDINFIAPMASVRITINKKDISEYIYFVDNGRVLDWDGEVVIIAYYTQQAIICTAWLDAAAAGIDPAYNNGRPLTLRISYDGSTAAPINVGEYTIYAEISDNNYQGKSRAAKLRIEKVSPAIIPPQASPIPVGSRLGDSVLTSGLAYIPGNIGDDKLRTIAGSFSFIDPDTIMDKANYQTVWVLFTPFDLTTCNYATFPIEIRVLGIDVSIAGVTATAITYGQPLKESSLSYSSSSVSGSIRWVDENEIVDVGAKARYVFIPDNPDVYNIVYGEADISVAKAEMDYNPATLLIKGYVGETLEDAVNHVSIELFHSDRPYLKVTDAVFTITDITRYNQPQENIVIEYSKQVYNCKLTVSHPNYNSIEIYAEIRTYLFLGSDNFYIANTSKQYDGEAVSIRDLGIKLVGTPEQLDLSIFRMKVTRNGQPVAEILEPGTYDVEISLFEDITGEDITMAYDGKCTFVYTVNKKVFGGESGNHLYIMGNTTVYGGAAGQIEAFYQYKIYRFNIASSAKVYNGAAVTVEDLGISVLNSGDLPTFMIVKVQRYNPSSSAYETVNSAVAAGSYIITLSLAENVLMAVTDAPQATVDIPFTIYAEAGAAMASASESYSIARYAQAEEGDVRFTYFSTNKLIEYGESAPASAGTYLVIVTFLASNPYYQGSQEFTYTVQPMEINAVLDSSYTFAYEDNIVIIPMFTAGIGSGTTLSNIGYYLQYSVEQGGIWTDIAEVPVNAGSYRVRVVLTTTDYRLAAGDGVARVDITPLRLMLSKQPVLTSIKYGQELYNSKILYFGTVMREKDGKTVDKDGKPIEGEFRFKEPNRNNLPAGNNNTVTVIFEPLNKNYASVEITNVPIDIQKASASIEFVVLEMPYTGVEQQPVVRTHPVSDLNVRFSYYQYINGQRQAVGRPRAAGTYDVVMEISDGNYEGSAVASFIIKKARITEADVVVPAISDMSYGQSLSYAAFIGGYATNPATGAQIAGSFKFRDEGLTLLGTKVQSGDGGESSSNIYDFVPYVSPDGKISDILGYYNRMPYMFVPSDTDNYEIFESTIRVKLLKAAATIKVYDKATGQYGNSTSFVYGEPITELTFLTTPMGLTIDNSEFMESGGLFGTMPSAGSYVFTARINDTNYTGELKFSVIINKRQAQIEFYDENNRVTEWYSYTYAATYLPKARIIASSLLPQDLQRKEEIESGLSYRYMSRGSSNVVWRQLPVNVGEYLVYAVLENENYYIDSEIKQSRAYYDITRAEVQYLDFDSSTLENLVYGNVRVPTVITRPAGISYRITFPGYEYMPTSAGTHRIKVVVDDPNFLPAEKTSMFHISKKDISIDNIKVYDRPFDGTDVIQITGELTGLVLNDEVRLTMTARTANGATEPGIHQVEILTWTISGQHAANYNVLKPVFNGTVKISQKVIVDKNSGSYISSDDGFSSNVTVSFREVASQQNRTNFLSRMLGQAAIEQEISIKEFGLETVLDKKVKFYVLIPEEFRNSPTLQYEFVGELEQNISKIEREGDYITFYADRSGRVIFYTNDFPYWIIVVGGAILIVIIGAIAVAFFAPVRRRKKIPAKVRNAYANMVDNEYYNSRAEIVNSTKARREQTLR